MNPTVTEYRVMKAIRSGDHVGFCTACGWKVHGVEPDAREYVCLECGKESVFGAEQLLLEFFA